MTDLKAIGFDVGLTGFADGQLQELFGRAAAKAGLTDPDATPEVPADLISRLGDVWLLGRHRIVCGDCTDAAVVERTLAGAQPHLMVTDPPYGVEYDATWRGKAGHATLGKNRTGVVEHDDRVKCVRTVGRLWEGVNGRAAP